MTALRIGWALALLAVGATQLARAWAGPEPVAVFVAALVATFALVLAGRAARLPAGSTALGVLVLAVGGAYLLTGAGSLTALTDLIPRLLTAARPAPPTPELLVPGALLVIVVALVVALAVLGNGRALVLPAFGAAVLYVAAALLTAGQADPRGVVAVVLVALTAIGWLVIDRAARTTRAGAGHLVPPAALVAVLAGLAVLAGMLPLATPFEPRTLVTPPVEDLPVASPLPQLASWAASGDTELFRVSGPPVPLRLVALADYTGATWRAGSVYGPLGVVAPPDLPPGARPVRTSVDVTIGALDGPWLPTAGRPATISVPDAVVDTDSGSLILPAGLRPGFRYAVASVVDAPQDADLLAAAVPNARRYLALPNLPFSLAEYARRTVASARTPFEQAVAIEEVVRTNRRTDAEAPVGSSYARLETFLFAPPGTPGAGEGTAEQFASAFAVLARAVGLPSRVVVGFRPAAPDGVIRGNDATAWPEVYFTGWGWVPFDPVPGTDDGPSSASKREVINRLATPTPIPSTPPPTAAPPTQAAAPEAAPAADPGSPLPVLLIPAVPALLILALAALRTRRRLRLRRAGPTGAWTYALDSLLLAGRTPPRHHPAPDVARTVAHLAPAAPRLAALADHAAFAPTPLPPAVAHTAWPLARQVRTSLRRITPWYRRLHWPLDPRPLIRRAR